MLVRRDRRLELASLGLGAGDVEQHVRVRHELVRLLELPDAFLVALLGDELHAVPEVPPRLGARVGPRCARREEAEGERGDCGERAARAEGGHATVDVRIDWARLANFQSHVAIRRDGGVDESRQYGEGL